MKLNDKSVSILIDRGYRYEWHKRIEEYFELLEKDDMILPNTFAVEIGLNPDEFTDLLCTMDILRSIEQGGQIKMTNFVQCPKCGEVGHYFYDNPEEVRDMLRCTHCGEKIDVDNDMYCVYIVQ